METNEKSIFVSELLKKRQEIYERIKPLQQLLDAIDLVLSTFSDKSAPTVSKSSSAPQNVRRKTTGLRDAAIAILKEQTRPLKTSELMALLRHSGFEVKGKRPMDTLRSGLSYYKDSFTKDEESRWSLRES